MLKRAISISFIALVFVLMTPLLSAAEQGSMASIAAGSEVVKGEIIVKFKPGVSDAQKNEVAIGEGAVIEKSLQEPDSKVMKIDETTDTVKAVTDLNNRPEVEYAEQNGVVKAEMVPNDPLNRYQWNFNAINMPSAWDMADGQGAIVAVIDTGVSYENYGAFHMLTDLAGTSFTGGWNFVNNTPHANDDHGHGSHVAGTVAQSTNNNFGVSGIAYKSTIMPVKVLNNSGSGTTAAVADGIRWAADHGAKVINLSLGSSLPSQTMEDAVNYARNTKNVVVVAAAGNGGRSGLIYPAAYESVISVAATDLSNNLTWYSQYGPGLDISAPGGDTRVDRNSDGQPDGILQQTIGSGNPATEAFSQYQGTSMATPHVSGVAALLVAEGVNSATQIQQILSSTARDLGTAGYDTTYGNGLLDAAAAVRTQGLAAPSISYPIGGEQLGTGSTVTINWDANGADNLSYNIAYSADGGSNWTDIVTITSPGATSHSWQIPIIESTYYKIRLRAVSGSEASEWSTSNLFTVAGPLSANPINWYVRKAVPGGFETLSTWNNLWGDARDTTLIGNFDGDSYKDIAVYRPSDSSWNINRSAGSSFGNSTSWATRWGNVVTDKPLVGDFDGDGKSDIAVHRSSSYPNWLFKLSSGAGFAPQASSLSWGNTSGDMPVVEDFNGDGRDDVGIYRKSSYPNWFIKLNSGSPGNVRWGQTVWSLSWGNARSDTPLVGDFNGDGRADVGLFRTGSYPNWFFLRASSNGNGFMTPQNTSSLSWGNTRGDDPMVGDFNGDGKDDIGIFRSSGSPNWFTNSSGNTGFDAQSDASLTWGNANTDEPFTGDFSGDGKDDLGLSRRQ